MNLDLIIQEGMQIIKNDKNHHLSNIFRQNFMKNLSHIERGRLAYLSALKVYPIWIKQWPYNNECYLSLKTTKEFLEKNISKEQAKESYINLSGRIKMLSSEQHFSAELAGLSAVSALFETVDSQAGKLFYEESDMEPDDWDAAFLACASFANGFYWDNSVDINKSKEFWTWYLIEALRIALTTDLLNLPKQGEEVIFPEKIQRKQCLLNEDKQFNDIINNICSLLQNLLKSNDLLVYKVNIIANSSYFLGEIVKNNTLKSIDDSYSLLYPDGKTRIGPLFFNLRNWMYNKFPNEGVWYTMKIQIRQDKKKEIMFDYDDINLISENFRDDYKFIEDMNLFPRDTMYIPDWLKKIMEYHS